MIDRRASLFPSRKNNETRPSCFLASSVGENLTPWDWTRSGTNLRTPTGMRPCSERIAEAIADVPFKGEKATSEFAKHVTIARCEGYSRALHVRHEFSSIPKLW
jgi:hypothetical protein